MFVYYSKHSIEEHSVGVTQGDFIPNWRGHEESHKLGRLMHPSIGTCKKYSIDLFMCTLLYLLKCHPSICL